MSSCRRIVEEEEKGQSMKEERISLQGWRVRDRAVETVLGGSGLAPKSKDISSSMKSLSPGLDFISVTQTFLSFLQLGERHLRGRVSPISSSGRL